MATIIGTDGTTRDVAQADGVSFTLAELHVVVGGYIEMITLAIDGPTREVLFVNEDGLLEGLAPNAVATAVALRFRVVSVPAPGIVGTAIRCRIANAGEDDERVY